MAGTGQEIGCREALDKEIEKRKRLEQKLKNQLEFQSLLISLSNSFINATLLDVDNAIEQAMASVAVFARVDRAYLFRYDFDQQIMFMTHEWRRIGTPSQKSEMKQAKLEDFKEDLVEVHQAGGKVYIPHWDILPETSLLRKRLKEQQVKNLITIPLMRGLECYGFIGFEAISSEKEWSRNEIELLGILAELFSNVEVKRIHDRQLVEARREAEEANQAKSQFLANMSHEIRTPMNGIIGFLDLLDRTSLDKDQEGYVKEIQTASDALLTLINDILDYSKMEAGKMLLDSDFINIHETAEASASLFSVKALEKNNEIVVYIHPDVPQTVQGDGGKIQQMLNNLVSNAVKFTRNGDILIELSVKEKEGKRVVIEFAVKDSGIGVSQENQKSLFQLFNQADGSTTRKYGGTGLGLSITKRLAEIQGGWVALESAPGKGSTFRFVLPLEVSENDLAPNTLLSELKGLKVLVVDDHAQNRFVLDATLRQEGLSVMETDRGEKALELLASLQPEEVPDIMLVDYRMPDMSGLELASEIQGDSKYSRMAMVMLSSASNSIEIRKMDNQPFLAIIDKPIRREILIKTIAKAAGFYHEKTETDKKQETSSLVRDQFSSILLVEDMESNRKLAKITLMQMGFSVDLAKNGQQAVEQCMNRKYDLILMDCQMPVMDGYEATRFIRESDNKNRDTTIIALTAHALEGERQKCEEAGMDGYITKPFKRKTLEEKLNQFARSRMRNSLEGN